MPSMCSFIVNFISLSIVVLADLANMDCQRTTPCQSIYLSHGQMSVVFHSIDKNESPILNTKLDTVTVTPTVRTVSISPPAASFVPEEYSLINYYSPVTATTTTTP
jgi:hypothetical protein